VIKGKIEGIEKLEGAVQKVSRRIFSETKKILRAEAVLMAAHIKKDLMSGPRPEKLGVRTGALRSSVKSMAVTESPGLIESGVGFGTQYARPHVGPKGQITTIRAKKGKFLAIPMAAAMTPSGVAKGAPRSGVWGQTFLFRLKDGSGRLMLFGKRIAQKGAKAGQARGNIVPLFLLVKQVKIKARIHPEEILAWEKPKMIAAFRNIGVNLKGA
jgi:hypothetical protein